VKRALLALLRFYKRHISPGLPQNRCKYLPTCSEYAYEAIERHGAIRGSLLAVWRVLRCNPFSRGGYDPVPEQFLQRKARPDD
jgi:putative membrane protein insertion efficiency factor